MRYFSLPMLVLGLAVMPFAASGQQQADSILLELQNMSAYEEASALQAQLNNKMGVGSQIGLSSRETPGIVSFITAEEIRALGARDFIDVMRLVPGFDFASDVDFAVGPTIRGIWAMEGKMLLMIDGVKCNELLFQALFFGNHLPVDQIERVEVIRGPGSAQYGGTAEYGVINIITKGAGGLNGISVSAGYGAFKGDMAFRKIGLSAGKRVGNVSLDFTASTNRGNRSNEIFSPMDDEEAYAGAVNLANGRGKTRADFISTGLKWQGLSARLVYDDYQWSSYFFDVQNKMLNAFVQYEAKIGKRLSLVPQLSYTNQLPWHFKADQFPEIYSWPYKVRAERTTASVAAGYRASNRVYLTAGAELYGEKAKDMLDVQNFGDVQQVAYQNFAVFGEALIRHRIANITAGIRVDDHSEFGSAWAPRLALTKHVNRLHFKGLASGAFRAPGIENINLSGEGGIRPEKTTSYELETGYQFTKDMLLSISLFNIKTRDFIVYYNDGLGAEGYGNTSRMGSRGLEMVYQIKRPVWFATLSYSYSRASEKNSVDIYKVEGQPHMNIGVAAHKATLHGGLRFTRHLSLNPSLLLIGERYGYASYDGEGNPILERFAPLFLLNLNLQYKDVLPGLSLGLAGHNLLDAENSFIQAYNGGSAPVPGPGRMFVLQASFDLQFKK